jgi:hypothetical protein
LLITFHVTKDDISSLKLSAGDFQKFLRRGVWGMSAINNIVHAPNHGLIVPNNSKGGKDLKFL